MIPLQELLRIYAPDEPTQHAVSARFTELLKNADGAAFDRDHFVPGHITASCWIVDPIGTSCLLTHHRKLNRWLQLGGHCDGDPDVIAAALREAREESGLHGFTLLHEAIYDLDIHEIPARKTDPTHLHYDVRFAFRAATSDGLKISEESHDLAWVPIDRLREYTTEESVLRLARKWQAIQVAR